MKQHIRILSPAAARLLLARIYADSEESFDDLVKRAGIDRYSTLIKAQAQLANLGFFRSEEEERNPPK